MKHNRKLLAVILILILSVTFAACGNSEDGSSDKKVDDTAGKAVDIDISFVGDIMTHQPQIDGAKTGDGYDFNNNFEYIKDYIEMSDLALCNLETTFAGKPYTGYPVFSGPSELAGAIKNAGFDVAVTANNHMLDKGKDGLIKTLDVLNETGIKATGTRSTPEEKDYLVTKVDGIKVGIIASTYETSKVGGQRTMNGTAMTDESAQLINSFSYEDVDEDLASFKESIDNARKDGAQVIIAYLHWGEEYEKEPNDHQVSIAEKVAGFGADVIFASHPHVLQKEDVVTVGKGENTRAVPVFYSMGNFISNQRTETLSNRYTEEGIIAQARITYNTGDDSVTNIETGYIPVWVEKYSSGGKNRYAVIPLIDDYTSNSSLNESGHVSRAETARSDIEDLLGAPKNLFEGK